MLIPLLSPYSKRDVVSMVPHFLCVRRTFSRLQCPIPDFFFFYFIKIKNNDCFTRILIKQNKLVTSQIHSSTLSFTSQCAKTKTERKTKRQTEKRYRYRHRRELRDERLLLEISDSKVWSRQRYFLIDPFTSFSFLIG